MSKAMVEEAARVLDEALALMNDEGKHWVKNGYMAPTEDGSYGFCSVGAVRRVIYGSVVPPAMMSTNRSRLERKALRALCDAYGPSPALNHHGEAMVIISWNDRSDTTWDKVVKRFTKARERLLREESQQ
jgi:hypothetical protein